MLEELIRGLPFHGELLGRLRRGGARTVVSGGVGALPGLLLAALASDLGRRLAVVVADEKEAERLAQDLAAGGATGVFRAPGPTLTPYQRIPPSLKARRDEFRLLAALGAGSRVSAVVLPAHGLFTRLPAPSALALLSVDLAEGEDVSLPRLTARLTEIGYRRGDLVIETGDLAVRGGLFDVFPPDLELPLRVELEGDRVVSIRVFDPDTQRSSDRLAAARIPPFAASRESSEERDLLAARIGRLPSEAERVVFAPAVTAMPAGWLDHAGDALLAVIEPALVEEEVAAFAERIAADRDPDRDVFAPEELLHPTARIRDALAAAPLAFDRLGLSEGDALRLPAEAIAGHGGRTAEAAQEISRALSGGEEVFLAARAIGGAEKARRFAREYDIAVASDRGPGALVVLPAEISAGFRLRAPRLSLYSESEIFGEEKPSATPRGRLSEAFLSDLRDLRLGDAVVHRDYGIGLFKGLKRVPVEGQEREFMEIGYAEDKTLLLPVDRFDLVQKYSGLEDAPPVLDRLGGAGWGKRKASVKRAMRDMTDQLLKLYARRRVAPGFTFSKDSPWQKEFEDAFEYTETPDQAQAIADVKRDMQSDRPMDRLLCGDVGYGKTEVAMRAAFKAVLDGKQVALLAPTTVLADQHFRTFLRRFAAFPVTIELLSRFRSRAEQKEIVAKVADGAVDILIATHRMLGKDLAFRDLGLLDRGRRAALRRRAEGEAQGVAHVDRRPRDVGHADPALAAPVAFGPAGPLDHRDAAARPARDRDAGRRRQARRHPGGHRGGDRARRAGLLRAQPRGVDRSRQGDAREARSLGADRRGPRRDAGGRAREGDAAFPDAGGRPPARDDHHRERPRHPVGQHHPDRPRRDLRSRAALPAPRPRRDAATGPRTRTCSSTRPPPSRTWRGAASPPSRSSAISAPGSGSRPRTSRSAARGTSSAASSPGRSRRSASRRTCSCWRRRSARSAGKSASPSALVTLSLGLDLTIPSAYVADENWRMMIYKKIARARDEKALDRDPLARSPTASGSRPRRVGAPCGLRAHPEAGRAPGRAIP